MAAWLHRVWSAQHPQPGLCLTSHCTITSWPHLPPTTLASAVIEHTKHFSASKLLTYNFLSLEHSSISPLFRYFLSPLLCFICIHDHLNKSDNIFLLVYVSLSLLSHSSLCPSSTYKHLENKDFWGLGFIAIYIVNKYWLNKWNWPLSVGGIIDIVLISSVIIISMYCVLNLYHVKFQHFIYTSSQTLNKVGFVQSTPLYR